MTNHYQTLGLANFASIADIRKAYKSLALKHHPDRGGDENVMKAINAAYDFLMQHKAEYDAMLQPNRQGFQIIIGGWNYTFHQGTDGSNSTYTFTM